MKSHGGDKMILQPFISYIGRIIFKLEWDSAFWKNIKLTSRIWNSMFSSVDQSAHLHNGISCTDIHIYIEKKVQLSDRKGLSSKWLFWFPQIEQLC